MNANQQKASNQVEIHSNSVRYVDPQGTVLAEVTFPVVAGNVVDINHTYVDESLRGQGIAGKLLENVAQELEETGRRCKTSCSYAHLWFERHPERASLLAS
ncbi:GNAT family N-acetyltransferase [Collinsella tanakaei]|uniref:GNAT family N-acetyltransferase n=1 Tax=Collinsella tanakaei TaxID=626935 RepID=UPI00195D9357|nr:GNAT family N-acetyltransferase [Collinsella tanakaei]MBM6868344.1 N-acetyltransferase [Collinsella tanakaei]